MQHRTQASFVAQHRSDDDDIVIITTDEPYAQPISISTAPSTPWVQNPEARCGRQRTSPNPLSRPGPCVAPDRGRTNGQLLGRPGSYGSGSDEDADAHGFIGGFRPQIAGRKLHAVFDCGEPDKRVVHGTPGDAKPAQDVD